MNRRTALKACAGLLGSLLALPLWAEKPGQAATPGEGEFFVISSVDAKKNQIVLKRPTEVTEVVRVSEKTAYLDEQGKALLFKELRAGDTVYVTFVAGSSGGRMVGRIRKGPMTVEELHRRYLRSD